MSSPIAWSDVLSLPGANVELADVPAGGQTMLINYVNSVLDVTMFDGEDGPTTKLARCFLAAHMAALGELGTGGPLTQESAGGLMRQYAMPAMVLRSEFMTTSYGRAFWLLIGPQAHGPRLL